MSYESQNQRDEQLRRMTEARELYKKYADNCLAEIDQLKQQLTRAEKECDQFKDSLAMSVGEVIEDSDFRKLQELEQLFEIRHKADVRAINQWREAHPDKPMTMPDHADLVYWLSEQLVQAQAACAAVLRGQCNTGDAAYQKLWRVSPSDT